MNKLVVFIFLFCIILKYCSCAKFRIESAIHKDHPDKCYYETRDHLFSPGENFKPIGYCAVLRCVTPGVISGFTCGKVRLPECKSIGKDLTKPHPYCCESFICTDENGQEFTRTPGVPRINKNDDLSKSVENNL